VQYTPHGTNEEIYKTVVKKPEGMRPFGIPRHRWENDVKLDHKDVRCEAVDCVQLVGYRDQWHVLVITVMKFSDIITDANCLVQQSDYRFLMKNSGRCSSLCC
jgi:hypothetical protein